MEEARDKGIFHFSLRKRRPERIIYGRAYRTGTGQARLYRRVSVASPRVHRYKAREKGVYNAETPHLSRMRKLEILKSTKLPADVFRIQLCSCLAGEILRRRNSFFTFFPPVYIPFLSFLLPILASSCSPARTRVSLPRPSPLQFPSHSKHELALIICKHPANAFLLSDSSVQRVGALQLNSARLIAISRVRETWESIA